MHLYYFRDHHGNFGDALNDWLWDTLMPGCSAAQDDVWLSGIGTILNHKMPKGRRWAVMGSGVGYGASPAGFGGPDWDIVAVRGPLSAKVLGLDADKAITDGAMLLSLLEAYAPAAAPAARSGIVFMPHYMSVAGGAWAEACALAGIEFLDPREDTHTLLAKLRSARLVIADAMHGAIVADTLRTPWVAASLNATTDSFKWNDWCRSMELAHIPHSLPPSTRFEILRNRALPLYGEQMLMRGADAEQLCARHHRTGRRQGSPLTYYRRKVTKRLVREVATAADHAERKLTSGIGHRRIEQAAEALRKLALVSPVLSDDVVFERQRQRMAEGLTQLAGRYNLSLANGLSL